MSVYSPPILLISGMMLCKHARIFALFSGKKGPGKHAQTCYDLIRSPSTEANIDSPYYDLGLPER